MSRVKSRYELGERTCVIPGKRSSVVPARERGRRPAPLPGGSIPSPSTGGESSLEAQRGGCAGPARGEADQGSSIQSGDDRGKSRRLRSSRRALGEGGRIAASNTVAGKGDLGPRRRGALEQIFGGQHRRRGSVHHSAARRRSSSTRPSGSGRIRNSALTTSMTPLFALLLAGREGRAGRGPGQRRDLPEIARGAGIQLGGDPHRERLSAIERQDDLGLVDLAVRGPSQSDVQRTSTIEPGASDSPAPGDRNGGPRRRRHGASMATPAAIAQGRRGHRAV